MKYKTPADVRTEIIKKYNDYIPQLDLTEGTPERDIFVEAPLEGFITPLWDYSVYVSKLHSPHTYASELDESDVNNYISTFQITPTSATYATGVVTFFTYNQPVKDIVIGTGTVVTTLTTPPVEFVTTSTAIIYAEKQITYYNVSTERWEISVSIRAQKSGPEYRAGKNSIIRITSLLNGIDGCINTETILGGAEAETVESKLRKVIQKFQGRDIASTSGMESFIKNISSTANVVWASDPLMLRDGGLGGAVDFYFIDENIVSTSESITITTTGLETPVNVNYTSTTITLYNQPVRSISSVIRNDEILESNKYSLTKDSGLLKKSTRSSDKIELVPTNGYQLWGFSTQVSEASPTGLSNNSSTYGFRLTVNGGTAQDILITGSAAQTIKTLCERITIQATGVTCSFDSVNNAIKIMSNTTGSTSLISILNVPILNQTASLFSSITNISSLPEDPYIGENIIPFTNGDKIDIAYSYNSILSSIENILYNEANHYHGRDYLAREMDEIAINLYARFKEVSGQDFNTIKSNVETAFISYVDKNKTQNVIELADVISILNQVNGVSNLDVSIPGTVTTDGNNTATISITSTLGSKIGTDIYIGKNQYMVSGTLNIERWSS